MEISIKHHNGSAIKQTGLYLRYLLEFIFHDDFQLKYYLDDFLNDSYVKNMMIMLPLMKAEFFIYHYAGNSEPMNFGSK